MLIGSSNEHPNKLSRVRDLLRDEFKVAPKPLPADYMFDANGKVVVVEVKWSVSDLLDSLQTTGEAGGPRLAVEVRKMLQAADIPIVLIPSIKVRGDGLILRDDGVATGWQYSSVKGILSDIALYGCIIDEWAADIATRLAQWYYVLNEEGHNWIRQLGRPDFITLDSKYREAVWCLCAFQGVGPVNAERLLRHFGSVAGVVKQSLKSLQSVKGIGPKVAKAIYEGVRAQWR